MSSNQDATGQTAAIENAGIQDEQTSAPGNLPESFSDSLEDAATVTPLLRTQPAIEPIGADGPDTDRDRATGRFQPGNRAAVLTGARSAAFWQRVQGARGEIVAAVLTDKGFTLNDAPEALRRAADGLSQAVLVRDSAFARLAEEGGPLSSKSRPRRAFQVWQAAAAAVERHVKLLGLDRKSKKLDLARVLSGLDRA